MAHSLNIFSNPISQDPKECFRLDLLKLSITPVTAVDTASVEVLAHTIKMSGFKIAGLVLGALPLVISALEHYDSSLDPVKAFFQWRDILEKAIRELWVQHTSFEMTLRNLLVDLTSEAELDELLSQPESPLWQSPTLNRDLRDRLGAAYDVYNYTIEQIGDHVRTLARHLDIDRVDVCLDVRFAPESVSKL